MTKIEVPAKDGGTKKKYQSVNSYRVEYLTRFCGYEKKDAVKLNTEQKRQKMLDEMFAKAKANIQ